MIVLKVLLAILIFAAIAFFLIVWLFNDLRNEYETYYSKRRKDK